MEDTNLKILKLKNLNLILPQVMSLASSIAEQDFGLKMRNLNCNVVNVAPNSYKVQKK